MYLNKNHSLRRQIIHRLILVVLIFSVIFYGLASYYITQVYIAQQDTLLQNNMQNIRHNIYLQGTKGVVNFPYAALDNLRTPEHDSVYYSVWQDTDIIMGYDFLSPQTTPTPPQGMWQGMWFSTVLYQNTPLRQGATTFRLGNHTYFISLATTQKHTNALIRATMTKASILLAVTFFLFFTLIFTSIRSVLRPLLMLAEQFKTRRFNDFSDFQAPHPKELKALVDTINTHMQRLQNAWKESDLANKEVAHQIRTPLAVLRGQLETAQIEPNHQDANTHIQSALDTIDTTIHMTNQLLHESYITHNLHKIPMHIVPIQDIMDDILSDMALSHPAVALTYTPPPVSIPVYCNPPLLNEAIKNSIDNACKYAHPQTPKVWVSCHMHPTACQIYVADNGNGIDVTMLQSLFHPFTRHDTTQKGGGLGLYSSHKILSFHQGSIQLMPNAPGVPDTYTGAVFCLHIPLNTQENES